MSVDLCALSGSTRLGQHHRRLQANLGLFQPGAVSPSRTLVS